MFVLLIPIAILIVLLIFLLPYLLGITLIKVERPAGRRAGEKKSRTIDDDWNYLRPDERKGSAVTATGLRERITQASPSLKIGLKSREDNKIRRRRGEKVDLKNDPNTFDYDVDELLREEAEDDRRESLEEFRRIQESGLTREDLV